MMNAIARICLLSVALVSSACCPEPTDYCRGSDAVLLDDGGTAPRTIPLCPAERQVLNAYIAENTNCWNTSYITYAPEEGVTLQLPLAKVCITCNRVILSVRDSADGVWSQYVKSRDATDEALLKLFK